MLRKSTACASVVNVTVVPDIDKVVFKLTELFAPTSLIGNIESIILPIE